ncbi:MAG: hypothetical protein FRX49_05596 [Trebouxia sp. A1-2]|nr:MAG: hypothetical protein FRX49_05596 [Trebouxia sp. A1-2]
MALDGGRPYLGSSEAVKQSMIGGTVLIQALHEACIQDLSLMGHTLIWISAYAPRRRGDASPLALPDTPEVKLPTDLLGPQGFSEFARAKGLKSFSVSDASATTIVPVREPVASSFE